LSLHGFVKNKIRGQSQKKDGYQSKVHQGEKYFEEYTSLKRAFATEWASHFLKQEKFNVFLSQCVIIRHLIEDASLRCCSVSENFMTHI